MAGFASAAPMIVLFAATGDRQSRGNSQPKPLLHSHSVELEVRLRCVDAYDRSCGVGECPIPTQWSEQQRTNSNGCWHVGLRRLGVERAEVHDRRRDDTREVLDRRIGLDIEQPVLRNDNVGAPDQTTAARQRKQDKCQSVTVSGARTETPLSPCSCQGSRTNRRFPQADRSSAGTECRR